MAAIARFISFDGGIAFSETSLKIQKRSESKGRTIPVSDIAAMDVSEPLLGNDGCIRFRLARERKPSGANVIYFDEDQYAEAVQFKVAFDTLKSRSREALPPLEMFLSPAPVREGKAKRAVRPARPPRRQRVRQPEIQPARAERTRPKRGGKLKKLLLVVFGGYAALLALGGLAVLFGSGPAHDTTAAGGATAAVSEAWLPQQTASPAPQQTVPPTPDAGVFLAQAKAAASGQLGEKTQITDVALDGRDLQISVDYADPAYLQEYDDSILLADSDRIVEPILALGEQYDALWDSMTVNYGPYGKVVKSKSDLSSQQDENSGSYDRRFSSANETVIHDVPLPEKQPSASSDENVGTSAVIAAGAAADTDRSVGSTSPPLVTDPPVTAPPEQRTEALVWIPTKGGKKYHKTSTCSGMNGPIQVTVSEAVSRGFTPCKKCY